MLAAHVALLATKAGRAVKIVYDRDEDIAATTKRHPARTTHRLAVDADGRARRDRHRRRDGRRRVPDAVAGRAVARRAARGRAVPLPGRARARPRASRRTIRRTARSAASARRRRRSRTSGRCRSSRARAARIRSRCASGSRCARATRRRPARCSAFSVGTDEVIAAIERVAGPPPARDGGTRARRRRCGAAAASCFYFHGAGFTGSGEQRLAGRATRRAHRRRPVRGALELDRHRPGRDHDLHADRGGGARRRPSADVDGRRSVDVARARQRADGREPHVHGRRRPRRARGARAARRGSRRGARARPRRRPRRARAGARGGEGGELAETVQYEPPPGIHWDDATYTGAAYPVLRLGRVPRRRRGRSRHLRGRDRCAACRRSTSARRSTRRSCSGQIEGGTLQALGWAVLENVVYKDGKVANANMTNCIVPTFADAPELETILVEVPYPFGPQRREGRRRDPDGRPGGGGRERRRGRARLRVRRAADLARGSSRRAEPRWRLVVKITLEVNGAGAHASRRRRGSACSTCCARTCGSPAPRRAAARASAARARVLLDGEAVNSCLVAVGQCDGRTVTTVEGLARGDVLHAGAARARRVRRRAVRHLHAGHRGLRGARRRSRPRARARTTTSGARAGPRAARRQHLPLHRLPADRRRGRRGGARGGRPDDRAALRPPPRPRRGARRARRASRLDGARRRHRSDGQREPPARAGRHPRSVAAAASSCAITARRATSARHDRRRHDVARGRAPPGDPRARSLPLALAAREIGALQIQARGTLGGNVGTSSPVGDSLPVLLALDADARGRVGARPPARPVPRRSAPATARRSSPPDELIVVGDAAAAAARRRARRGARSARAARSRSRR